MDALIALRECTRTRRLNMASMQFHFISSRLRLHLQSNDFSVWLDRDLGLKDLARRVNQIDLYTNTLDSARARIINLVEKEMRK